MNITIQTINPNFIEHEGFVFLEFNGEYFKGCKRCGGDGHYSHNGEHSRCYECDNTSAKLGEVLDSYEAGIKWCHTRAMARANRLRKAEEKRMIEVRKMEAKQEALKATDPDVFEFLMGIEIDGWEEGEKDSFIRSMAESIRWVTQANKPFTQKMIDAVRNNMARRVAKAATIAANPAPNGRVVVTGEVVSARFQDNDFGGSYKMLVKDDQGFKVWSTIPNALMETTTTDEAVGRRVTFVATLTVSNDDTSFAFASRPAKGVWLA